jgi:hypothetical protein
LVGHDRVERHGGVLARDRLQLGVLSSAEITKLAG